MIAFENFQDCCITESAVSLQAHVSKNAKFQSQAGMSGCVFIVRVLVKLGFLHTSMVQDSITDHIDTARENSSHLNFTYRMAIIFAEIAPWYVTNPRF